MAKDPRSVDKPENQNEEILDDTVRHMHFVEQFKNGLGAQVVDALNDQIFPEIIAATDAALERIGVRPATRQKRLGELQAKLEQIIAETALIQAASRDQLIGFAQTEAEQAMRAVVKSAPSGIQFDMKPPDGKAIRNSVIGPPGPRGTLWRNLWTGLRRDLKNRVMAEIQIGLDEQESIPKITQRLRGTRANAFKDGVFQTTRNQAQAIIRTTSTYASSKAKEAAYEVNSDIVGKVRYVATLDSRTTIICASLDGKEFPIDEGPRPPQHINCRSTTVPVIKPASELGIPGLKDIPASERASVGGPVKDITYVQWLRRQPVSVQNEVLGVTRAKLWRGNRLKIDKFLGSDNRVLTLDELRQKTGLGG